MRKHSRHQEVFEDEKIINNKKSPINNYINNNINNNNNNNNKNKNKKELIIILIILFIINKNNINIFFLGINLLK